MDLSLSDWGQILTLVMIAIALGMDALSVGIGMGMHRPSYKKIAIFSLLVGIFHVLMPLIGIYIGQYLSIHLKTVAAMIGGGMLCFLGGNMILQYFKSIEQNELQVLSLSGIFLISLSVSLDSLSAGLSMGLFSANQWLAVTLFGLAGTCMSGAGVVMGRYVGSWLGKYGEVAGGMILFILGVNFLW